MNPEKLVDKLLEPTERVSLPRRTAPLPSSEPMVRPGLLWPPMFRLPLPDTCTRDVPPLVASKKRIIPPAPLKVPCASKVALPALEWSLKLTSPPVDCATPPLQVIAAV